MLSLYLSSTNLTLRGETKSHLLYMKIRFQNMNHSLFTLKQNNFKTPVNAVARSTLDADLCVLSLTLKLYSPKKKRENKTTSEASLLCQRPYGGRVMRRCVRIRAPSVKMTICEPSFPVSSWCCQPTNDCTSFKVNIIGAATRDASNYI